MNCTALQGCLCREMLYEAIRCNSMLIVQHFASEVKSHLAFEAVSGIAVI